MKDANKSVTHFPCLEEDDFLNVALKRAQRDKFVKNLMLDFSGIM